MLDEWRRKISGGTAKSPPPGWKQIKYLLVAAICLGLLALIWPSNNTESASEPGTQTAQSAGVGRARADLAADLEQILSQVEGAGTVQVSITLSSDGLKNYARNTKNEHRETQEADNVGGDRNIVEESQSSDIAVSGGAALLVEDSAPEVVGVLVVADGAVNTAVKEKLTSATATLLNISPYQVRVEARKGNINGDKQK